MSGKTFFILCIIASLLLSVTLFWGRVEESIKPVFVIADLFWPSQTASSTSHSSLVPTTVSTSFKTNEGIIGSRYEGKEGMSPRFSVNFLDSTQVDLYADDAKIGNTCTYIINGDNIVITHACGTWHLDKRGEDYFNEELNWTFIKK